MTKSEQDFFGGKKSQIEMIAARVGGLRRSPPFPFLFLIPSKINVASFWRRRSAQRAAAARFKIINQVVDSAVEH